MENNNSTIICLCVLAMAGAYLYYIYKSEKRSEAAFNEQAEYFKWVKEQDFPEKTKNKEKSSLVLMKNPEMEQ